MLFCFLINAIKRSSLNLIFLIQRQLVNKSESSFTIVTEIFTRGNCFENISEEAQILLK